MKYKKNENSKTNLRYDEIEVWQYNGDLENKSVPSWVMGAYKNGDIFYDQDSCDSEISLFIRYSLWNRYYTLPISIGQYIVKNLADDKIAVINEELLEKYYQKVNE